MRFKADNVDPILNSASCYGIHADFSARPVRNLIRGNVEHGGFLCNYSFITALVRRQENQHALRSRWSSSPLPGHRMCTSDRQSNMTAIYTHWVRWKLLALSLRPRSPKRMGEETAKGGKKACKFLYSGLSRMLSCGRRTDVHAHSRRLYGWVRACAELQQRHGYTHAVTNTAVRAFDVQGAVSVVRVCPLISFPALRVKHGNKGKQHIQKCQTTHLAFHVSWITATRKQLQSVQTQDRLIDSGCCRRREVRAAESTHRCHGLSSSKTNSN